MSPSDNDLVTIALMPSGRRGQVPRGTNLLEAARRLGVELESICAGRQTCGKCQVVVETGHFPKHGLTSAADHLTPMDGREAKYLLDHQLAAGRRLACACEATGDLLLLVPEESQARKQIIAKAATDRAIDVQPAVRQVYVEVAPATLDSHVGDWERLQAALAEQHGLRDLTIDLSALAALQPALAQGRHAVTVAVWHDRAVLRVQPGYSEGAYGLAADIGSTTIVVHLCDLRTGAVLATEASMNPQVRFGEDLMSRVSYVMMHPDGTEKMHRAVITTLNDLARKAAQAAGVKTDDVLDAVLVGNPVMHHLLLGLSPVELGGAPFALALNSALDLKAAELGLRLNPAARAHVLPCIAGHVGADNVAVQLAEAPHQQDDLMLIVDVGTNGEIVLGNRDWLMTCACSAGPAFEGAGVVSGMRATRGAIEEVWINSRTHEPTYRVIGGGPPRGLCGSGLISLLAELFITGVADKGGNLDLGVSPRVRAGEHGPEYVVAWASETAHGRDIVISKVDIDNLMRAKAAIYAGFNVLAQSVGLELSQVERLLIGGSFGKYINVEKAVQIGLLPDMPWDHFQFLGNTSAMGAYLALLSRDARVAVRAAAEKMTYLELSADNTFYDAFTSALFLPHTDLDRFPSVAALVGAGRAPQTEIAP